VLAGGTTNFKVSYSTALHAAEGQELAEAILGRCEQDLSQLSNLFGGIIISPNTSRGRDLINVIIDPATPPSHASAYHFGCSGREIHCLVESETDGNLANFLNCAELAEVFMAFQARGWNCGASAGEGLSRVLATELYPASLGRFASASTWLNSVRLDWVTQTEGTDRDYVSIGCATLFINYLRHQLNFSLAQIIQAGGATLQQTYEQLTGRTDAAFGPFKSLLDARFPPDVAVDLPNDNPFPLIKIPNVLKEPREVADRDIRSAGLVPAFMGATNERNTAVKSEVPSADTVVSSGSIVRLELVVVNNPV
jgi:hypothetical protein